MKKKSASECIRLGRGRPCGEGGAQRRAQARRECPGIERWDPARGGGDRWQEVEGGQAAQTYSEDPAVFGKVAWALWESLGRNAPGRFYSVVNGATNK